MKKPTTVIVTLLVLLAACGGDGRPLPAPPQSESTATPPAPPAAVSQATVQMTAAPERSRTPSSTAQSPTSSSTSSSTTKVPTSITAPQPDFREEEEVAAARSTSVRTSTSVQQAAAYEEGEAEAALRTVDRFYAALNAGDVDGAFALLIGGTRLRQQLRLAVEGLNAQFGHDCTLGSAGSILCVESITDALYGPAGITHEARISYGYGESQLVVSDWHNSFVCRAEPAGHALSFLIEFRVWAAETHPELEGYWLWGWPIDSVLAIPCTVYPFTRPENAIAISEIVPEFVQQSDIWPLGDV